MLIKSIALSVALLAASTAPVKATDKYFGYFGGDYTSVPDIPDLHEFQDHANLYSILTWTGTSDQKAGSETYVLGELERARAAHVHAIVPAFPFVFQHMLHEQGYRYDATASASWDSVVQKMLDRGLLIPGDPARSTVVAIYIVDEPNGFGGLTDQGGQPHPALANAVAAIRGNAATAHVPIAAILTPNFDSIAAGGKLLDWVGFDHYGDSDKTWKNTLNAMKNTYFPGKKYILAAGASYGKGCTDAKKESPARYISTMDTDPNVVWLAPFLWTTRPDCPGVRDQADLRATYTAEGLKIKNAECDASLAGKWFCGKTARSSAAVNLLLGD